MKLTFPPKRIQFWFLFSGFTFSALSMISLFWCNSITMVCNETAVSLFYAPINMVSGFQFTLFHPIVSIIIFLFIFYTLLFWFLGSIIWMIRNYFKNRAQIGRV